METKLVLADIYAIEQIDEAFKDDNVNLILNQQPKQSWIKQNKYAGNSSYIPIGIIETLLQKIFKRFKIEVTNVSVLFNAVSVTVRVHYADIVTGEWRYHDGVGAVQLQTKAGASPAQLESINNNAVQMALPMAKSYAIKDACEHFGALFGRDLNRKDTLMFSADKNLNDKVFDREKKVCIKYISECVNAEILGTMIGEAEYYGVMDLFNAKKEQLNGE